MQDAPKNAKRGLSLTTAIKSGDLEKVKAVLDGVADKNDQLGKALAAAVRTEHPQIVAYLAPLCQRHEVGVALLAAVRKGNIKVVGALLPTAAEASGYLIYGALPGAVKMGRIEIVKALLDAAPGKEHNGGGNEDILLQAVRDERADIAALLLEQLPTLPKFDALFHACKSDDKGLLPALIATGTLSRTDCDCLLRSAAYVGSVDALQEALKVAPATTNGGEALFFAAHRGHTDVVRILAPLCPEESRRWPKPPKLVAYSREIEQLIDVEGAIEVERKRREKIDDILAAVAAGDLEAVVADMAALESDSLVAGKALADAVRLGHDSFVAKLAPLADDGGMDRALVGAVTRGSLDVVGTLLPFCGNRPNTTYAAMWTAIEKSRLEIIEALIPAMSTHTVSELVGRAAGMGNTEAALTLFAGVPKEGKRQCMKYAVEGWRITGKPDALLALLQAEPSDRGMAESALLSVARANEAKTLTALMDYIKPDQDLYNRALMYAARAGAGKTLSALLSAGADPTHNGSAALFLAAQKEQIDIVRILAPLCPEKSRVWPIGKEDAELISESDDLNKLLGWKAPAEKQESKLYESCRGRNRP